MVAPPSVKVHQVTVVGDHMTVDWLYDGSARRRRRSVTDSVSVVVHYRKEDGPELTYPPDAPDSTLPATDRHARINGTFDVLMPYTVWLTVYEAQQLSHSTDAFQQLPSLNGTISSC